ncbi:assembly factor cbp4 [Lodderomyces elongisporus]|uniref:assembly factor cbp4 n=1 Tax=Lodderomyces elongisporus TaxID=36914 RepID=UPI002925C65C|nr:assembly factor cbp4 [Lodderomyces elongisporus]WLF76925.1 assembly factor cbp4 [Lodderomyces elongisporus]
MAEKPLWYRWARVYFAGGCLVGLGVVLYKTIRPTDEELISRFSPEIRAEYERNKELRQKEQQRLMEIVKKTSASTDPIWKTGPIGSPLEKDQRNLSMQLVDQELFHKTKEEEKQKAEINKSVEESKEVERLLRENKNQKSWWKFW